MGFSVVGISKAEHLGKIEDRFDEWIDKGYYATMEWIKNRSDERKNIFNYFPEAKSVISVGMNYFSGNASDISKDCKISNYAWGDDYHILLKNKIYELLKYIKTMHPDIKSRVCVDTSPILDKVWAQKGGIGWQGKHTNLINREYGSWLFLGELILDIDLEYDDPFKEDLCGTCTACIDECPTEALSAYQLDANKCISYLTIEHRDEIDKQYIDYLDNWIYGCDICQEVCPWNIKFEQITNDKEFHIRDSINDMKKEDWKEITEDNFKIIFKNSAVKRTKYSGLKRNINNIVKDKN